MKYTFPLVRRAGFLCMVIWLSTTATPLQAQWIRTDGPFGVDILTFAVAPNQAGGTNLFAGTDAGVFLSTNDGTSWTGVNTGLTDTFVRALAVATDSAGGTNLFAGTYGGVFLSSNGGASWTAVSDGVTNTFIIALAVSPSGAGVTNLFAATYGGDGKTGTGGVILSTNNGTSWTSVNTGLTNTAPDALAIFPNGTGGENLFAGTDGGVFLSTNNGTSWSAVNSGLMGTGYTFVFAPNGSGGTNLFAGTYASGIFLSTNNGTSWTSVSNGLTNPSVRALAASSNGAGGTDLFASIYGGVFLSTNNGASWIPASTGLTDNTDVWSLAVLGTNLFAGSLSDGVWKRPILEMITSAKSLTTELPTNFSLGQNYPNPFNPSTTISFSLSRNSFVSLKVFDALGREVSDLLASELAAGTYARQWDAAAVPSGVYFYRMQAGPFTETKKLLLLK